MGQIGKRHQNKGIRKVCGYPRHKPDEEARLMEHAGLHLRRCIVGA